MKVLRGTLFGGIAYFLLGWLIYGILLMDFLSANTNTCANRPNGEMIWWAIILSNLSAGLLLTLFLNWSKASGLISGLKLGAVFGLLYACIVDFSFWSMTTIFSSLTVLIVDVLISAVVLGIVGMVIVLTWGKES